MTRNLGKIFCEFNKKFTSGEIPPEEFIEMSLGLAKKIYLPPQDGTRDEEAAVFVSSQSNDHRDRENIPPYEVEEGWEDGENEYHSDQPRPANDNKHLDW